MKNDSQLPDLVQLLSENDGTVYAVGGCVRDELLGQPSKDIDCEVFGIEQEKLEAILTKFSRDHNLSLSHVGKSFRVYKLRDNLSSDEIDISLPRRDKKVGEGHKGFEVTADPYMSIQEAASRRDFTINTLMKDLSTGVISDPTGLGLSDLRKGIIRMVSDSAFSEDPLRVLRAIQFASRFQFQIDVKTWGKMQYCPFHQLPTERVWGELEKILLKSERPSWGLETLMRLHFFKELTILNTTPQDTYFHPEGDVFTHTMMAVDEASKLVREKGNGLSKAEAITVLLAVLCHDFGKATTTETSPLTGRITAHGHADAGVPFTEKFLDRLGIFTIDGFDVRSQVLNLVKYHLIPPQLFVEKQKNSAVNVPRALRRLSLKVRLDLLAMVSLSDQLGRSVSDEKLEDCRQEIKWFMNFANTTGVEKTAPEKILKGHHLLELGMKPGLEMGKLLDAAYELQLDGQLASLEQAKSWVISHQLHVPYENK